MQELKPFIKTVRWKDLRPGMIILEDLEIAGRSLADITNYETLQSDDVQTLQRNYHLNEDRPMRVLFIPSAAHANMITRRLKANARRIQSVEKVRQNLLKLLEHHDLQFENLYDPGLGVALPDYMIRDRLNSVSGAIKNAKIPSLLTDLSHSLNLADMLAGPLSEKINLPADEPVVLHLVLDSSYSIKSKELSDLLSNTANFLQQNLAPAFPKTEIRPYLFSESCIRIDFPVQLKGISRGGTHYHSFLKAVISGRDKTKKNAVLLLTDGEPEDIGQCGELCKTLRKHEIDYTQICFSYNSDRLRTFYARDEMKTRDGMITGEIDEAVDKEMSAEDLEESVKYKYGQFTSFADMCNGNQILLRRENAIDAVAMETYDRYCGILTAADGLN